jgi:outer membrane protein TolC
MNKISSTIFALALMLSLNTNVVSQQLTLEEAVNTALMHNPKIKQYRHKLKQKEYEAKGAFGNFLPEINIEGGYTHLNDDMSVNLNPIRNALIQMQSNTNVQLTNLQNQISTGSQLPIEKRRELLQNYQSQLDNTLPSFNLTFKEKNFQTATITGVQPIFMGGKILAGKNYAESEKSAARFDLERKQDEIINEVFQKYITVIFLKEVVKTRKMVLEGMKRHKDKAKRLLEEGVIANHQLLRAKVAVSEAKQKLKSDKNNLELAKLALKNSLGKQNYGNIILKDSLNYKLFKNELNGSELNLDNQPLLKMITQKKNAAKQKYKVERSDFLPQIALFGKYELYPQYLSTLEPEWAIGVKAKFNLFNGFKDYTSLQSAEHLKKEVEQLKIDTKRKFSLLINKKVRQIENSEEDYKELKATLKLAEENLRMNRKRFEAGMGTSLEVIDATLSLQRVKINRLDALRKYYSSISEFLLAKGNSESIVEIWNNKEI